MRRASGLQTRGQASSHLGRGCCRIREPHCRAEAEGLSSRRRSVRTQVNAREGDRGVYGTVPRYFFDTRDGERFIADDIGLDFETFQEVRDAATAGLADLAKDVNPGRVRRELAVEVRDNTDHRLIRASSPR